MGLTKDDLILPLSYPSIITHTGIWRNIRPEYKNRIPPCNSSCPVGEDIEGFIRFIREGNFDEALMLIRENNPFPGVCGRICFHPCEDGCNRRYFDGTISINA